MTRTGEIRRHWTITGKWGGRTPPEGAIPIDLPLTHHSIGEMANGNFLLCSAELRDYADWPSSEQPAEARPEPARVVGDVIFEVTPEGAVVNQWPMLDLLDPYRLSYGSRSGYWRSRGFPDSFDWCHTNAAIHDRRDDTIIASLRTQDCMVKFDRTTGALRWILGPSANWKAPWAEKLLRPEGDVEWAYHQHDCSVTPGGNVLCFDNGNHRALPPDGKMAEAESYSRAVEFAVDEEAGTVRQVWAYGDAADEKLFASYQGGAYRLPKTGNTFITYGGVCTTGGKPSGNANSDTCVARLMEVTPEHDIVFDMWIDGTKIDPPQQLSAFRAEHVPTD
jgi:arylsulfate sulfotransferase